MTHGENVNGNFADGEDDSVFVLPFARPALEQFADFLWESVALRRQRDGRLRSDSIFLSKPLYHRAAMMTEAFSDFQRTVDRISRSAVGSITMR
jgi:hypothetical protein